MLMLIINTIITEIIMIDVRMTIIETDVMIQMVAAVVAEMIAVVIYVHYIFVIHAVNAVEEIYVRVSRR